MARYYTAPPDDPHGNAGKTIGTDDQGNFWIAGAGEGQSPQSVPGATVVGGDTPIVAGSTPGTTSAPWMA